MDGGGKALSIVRFIIVCKEWVTGAQSSNRRYRQVQRGMRPIRPVATPRIAFVWLGDEPQHPTRQTPPRPMRYTLPMNRWLRTLLLWLLMLAIPLQSIAASAQFSCSPSDHAAMRSQPAMSHHLDAAPTSPAGDGPSQHSRAGQHTDHSQHAHHHQSAADANTGAMAMEMAAASAFASTPQDASVSQSPSTCSACALCCVGATAPPSAAVDLDLPSLSSAIVIAPADHVASHVLAGLERPPRPVSA